MKIPIVSLTCLLSAWLAHGQTTNAPNDNPDVFFGPGIQKSSEMTVTFKDKEITTCQVGQTTAFKSVLENGEYVVEKGKLKSSPVSVSLWKSMPFHAGFDVDVNGMSIPVGDIDTGSKGFSFPKKRVIEIDETDDKYLLLPSKESIIPLYINVDMNSGKVDKTLLVRAVNVTWVFKKSGTKFETLSRKYVTTKDGATVVFTADGVKLDGITAIEKPSNNSHSTNQPSPAR